MPYQKLSLSELKTSSLRWAKKFMQDTDTLAQLPRTKRRNRFIELDLVDRVVFRNLAQAIKLLLPETDVYAAGSRVKGTKSEVTIFRTDGSILRKKSDFDLYLAPVPNEPKDLALELTKRFGVKVDIMTVPTPYDLLIK